MILLILPTQYEFNILQFVMPEPLNGKVVVQSPGMGKLRTLGCLYETLQKYGKLDWVILAGYAGSLDGKALPLGEMVQATHFREGDFDAGEFESDAEHVIFYNNGNVVLNGGWKHCPFVSQDRFLKTDPYRFGNPYATDMESYAVAKFCKSHGVRYSVVKVISDVVGENSERLFKDKALELADSMNYQITMALYCVNQLLPDGGENA